ncbi:hypothetical protein [Hydrogenophaga sp. BPS33]|uniref:hypothetical protein n=1 Tax=Hydrogenophaga sp. BPS33 TaxID=2651974 RepID=UPI00131FAD1E|nr:hypothetical protein [Hydrogenophaga sp. BPS33]QHE89242.1 hypothetical protein F9K07_30110 [Hydrogenophaga sp. BPS33]
MAKASSEKVGNDEVRHGELRTRIRLPAAMGRVYDHLIAMPSLQRGKRIQQLIVLGYLYEAQFFPATDAGPATMGMPPPEPLMQASKRRNHGSSRSLPASESHAKKAVADSLVASRATARERIGSPFALLPID